MSGMSMFGARALADQQSAPAIAILGKAASRSAQPQQEQTKVEAPSSVLTPVRLPQLSHLSVNPLSPTLPVIPVVKCVEASPNASPPVTTNGQTRVAALLPTGVVPLLLPTASKSVEMPRITPATSKRTLSTDECSDHLVSVRPWYVGSTHNVLALQILDARLLEILQSMIRTLYKQIAERHKRLPSATLEWKKVFQSIFVHARRTYCRDTTVPKTQAIMQQVANQSESHCLRHTAFPHMRFVPVPPLTKVRVFESGMPFTQPVSMLAEDVASLFDGDRFYFWTYKSDGMRLLWKIGMVGSQKMNVWIDRKGRCWSVPNCHLPDRFYKGTTWDGELVRLKDGTRSFLTFDCLASCGRTVGEYDYVTRLQIASCGIEDWEAHVPSAFGSVASNNLSRALQKTTTASSTATVQDLAYSTQHQIQPWLSVRVKRIFATADIARLVRDVLPSLDHQVDGLVGIPTEDPIVMNKCETLFKIKVDHTIDWKFRLHSEFAQGCHFVLYTHDTKINKDVAWTIHGLCTVSYALAKQHGASHPRFLDQKIVECRFVAEKSTSDATLTGSWRLSRIRTDKKFPNNLETVENTWLNIKQSLRLSDIFPAERFQYELVSVAQPDSKMGSLSALHRQPPSWQVLKLRELAGNDWQTRNEEADAIVLPQPTWYGPYSTAYLKKAFKTKCSPWSYEGFVHSLLSK